MRRFRLHVSKGCLPQIVFSSDLKSALRSHVDLGFYIFGATYAAKVLNFIKGEKE